MDEYRNMSNTNELILEGTGNGVSSISDEQFRRTMVYPLISAEYIKEVGDHNVKVLMLAEQTTRKFM